MRTGSVALKIHNGCAEKAKKLNVSKGITLPSHLYFQFESQSCHINAKRRTCYQLGHYLTTTSQLQFESQSCHINTKEHDVANWATPIAKDQQKPMRAQKELMMGAEIVPGRIAWHGVVQAHYIQENPPLLSVHEFPSLFHITLALSHCSMTF